VPWLVHSVHCGSVLCDVCQVCQTLVASLTICVTVSGAIVTLLAAWPPKKQ